MPNCPSCGSPITENRNNLAERFAHKLPYPCSNQNMGCKYKSLLCDLPSHEAVCPHRLYCCVPCRPRCRWKGRKFQVRHKQDSPSGLLHRETSKCKLLCRTELWDGFDTRITSSSGMTKRCVISGFRRGINETFALLGCYAT
jgi:hypothetical protein